MTNLPIIGVVIMTLVLALGCTPGDTPGDSGTAPKDVSVSTVEPAGADSTPGPPGFFSELEVFIGNPEEIRRIGTSVNRLNRRYELIIDPHRELLEGSRVLDLGSYDGRWTYAALEAGAKHVTGIEINPDFVDQASTKMETLEVSPDSYRFVVGDILTELRKMPEDSIDGVLCLGIYYHINYHVELLQELSRIGADWIVMDTRIVDSDEAVVYFDLNRHYGIEGTPSRGAMALMANSLGYKITPVPAVDLTGPSIDDYLKGLRVTLSLIRPAGGGS